MNRGMLIEGHRKLTERTSLLFIDSRDKDPSYATRSDPFEYTVQIDGPSVGPSNAANGYSKPSRSVGRDPYNNVSKITLKALTFPKIKDEDYVIMTIGNLGDNMDSTSLEAHRSSCTLFFDRGSNSKTPSKGQSPGEIKTIYPIAGMGCDFIPVEPIRNLSKIDVKFRKHETIDDMYQVTSSGANWASNTSYTGSITNGLIKPVDVASNANHSFLLEITELV
jgi:hypothetical protein